MKKAALIFGLCFALGFGGLLTAAGVLHGDRDQVTVTETTLSGDPAAAQGLMIRQKAQLRQHLLWETELLLGPSNQPAAAFSYHPKAQTQDIDDSQFSLSMNCGWSAIPENNQSLEALTENTGLQPLLPVLQNVASRTQPGETHEETVQLDAYLDFYPLSAWCILSPEEFGLDPKDAHRPIQLTKASFAEFFRFPIPEKESWDFSISKALDGSLSGAGYSNDSELAFSSPNVFLGNRCFFTLVKEGRPLDLSQSLSGVGLYCIDIVKRDADFYGENLRTVYSLDPAAQTLDLDLSPDGQSLLLAYLLDDTCYCAVLDPDTMAVRQTLSVPAYASYEKFFTVNDSIGSYTISETGLEDVLVQDDLLLFYGFRTFHLFQKNAEGDYIYQLTGERPEVGGPNFRAMQMAWNGDRLAMGFEAYPNGLSLAVYSRTGETLYVGQYALSINETSPAIALTEQEPSRRLPAGYSPDYYYDNGNDSNAVKALENDSLTLTWKEDFS